MDNNRKFKKYLEQNSHDKPNTFFGAWAWYLAKKKEFEKKLRKGKVS